MEERAREKHARIVKINLDETSLALRGKSLRGHVFGNGSGLGERVSKQELRACFTHIALVSDQIDVQRKLPQYIVGNEHLFPARRMHELRARAPGNVRLVRQRSAWNNSELCCDVIKDLAAALSDSVCQAVLFMDACRIHITRDVLQCCKDCNLWVIIIPGGCTAKLQPLDTHVFSSYKARLATDLQRARIASPANKIDVSLFLDSVYSSIQATFEMRDWNKAFSSNGFAHSQKGCSRSLVDAVSQDISTVGAQKPGVDQLRLCFPRGAAVSMELVLWAFPEPREMEAVAPVVRDCGTEVRVAVVFFVRPSSLFVEGIVLSLNAVRHRRNLPSSWVVMRGRTRSQSVVYTAPSAALGSASSGEC